MAKAMLKYDFKFSLRHGSVGISCGFLTDFLMLCPKVGGYVSVRFTDRPGIPDLQPVDIQITAARCTTPGHSVP